LDGCENKRLAEKAIRKSMKTKGEQEATTHICRLSVVGFRGWRRNGSRWYEWRRRRIKRPHPSTRIHAILKLRICTSIPQHLLEAGIGAQAVVTRIDQEPDRGSMVLFAGAAPTLDGEVLHAPAVGHKPRTQ
jgi:anti-sigma factor ChrR (cupin superfamily)